MNWENLTAPQFAQAVKDTGGVCILPVGCIEKHGDHLPLGTDLFFGRDWSLRAAAIEPAIVFTSYPFGQISEARHCPGTIALDGTFQLQVLQAVCDEIARNGCKKIIIPISHGGNGHMLRYFAQMQLDKRRDYVVYVHAPDFWPIHKELDEKFGKAEGSGHADINESGFVLAYAPETVDMDAVNVEQSRPLLRMEHLHNAYTGLHWYGNYPHHFAGNPIGTTAERGAAWRDYFVDDLVKTIRSVKSDTVTAALQAEFNDKAESL